MKSVQRVAAEMLAQAQQTTAPERMAGAHWSVGINVKRRWYLEGVSASREAAKHQSDSPELNDFTLCGIRAETNHERPDLLRLIIPT